MGFEFKKHFKAYFLPSEDNDYKPLFLRRKIFLVVLVIVLILEGLYFLQSFVILKNKDFLAVVMPQAVIGFTNEVRERKGLKPLSQDLKLKTAAQQKAEDMAQKSYFSQIYSYAHSV